MEEKQRHGSAPRLEWLKHVGGIFMMSGFALVVVGTELNQPAMVRHQLDSLAAVCMVLGVCLVFGSLLFMIHNGRRLSAYNQAKCSYECRREILLQDIYACGQDEET